MGAAFPAPKTKVSPMIIKNSLKNIIRARGKTALFVLLLAATTLVLCLGLAMRISISAFLEECDGQYTTLALFEYMGGDYPNESAFTAEAAQAIRSFDETAVTASEHALGWDREGRALGYAEGFFRVDESAPLRDLAVLRVYGVSQTVNGTYGARTAFVRETLSCRQDLTENAVQLLLPEDFTPEKGTDYIICGVYENAGGSQHMIYAQDIDCFDGSGTIPGVMAVPAEGLSANAVQYILAESLDVARNSVTLKAANMPEAVYEFHQGLLYIQEGRFYTAEEAARGDRVCIVTEVFTQRTGLGLGDTVALNFILRSEENPDRSYWAAAGFDATEEYTIVGVANAPTEYQANIYIPHPSGLDTVTNAGSYTIGSAVIENDAADTFLREISDSLPERVRVTVYDQGYGAAAGPFAAIERIATLVSAVCLSVTAAVLLLFGYLFVHRQRETTEAMLLLGAGKTRVFAHFLLGAFCIALIGTALGALGANRLVQYVEALILRLTESISVADDRFSSAALTIAKELPFAIHLQFTDFLAIAAVVLALCLLLCLPWLIAATGGTHMGNRHADGPKKARKSSALPGTPFKYALLSLSRGKSRTLVVPLVAAAAVLLLCHLAGTAAQYDRELTNLRENTVISGAAMDIHGRSISGLLLEPVDVNEMLSAGVVTAVYPTATLPCMPLSSAAEAAPDLRMSESLVAKIKLGDKIHACTDINCTPEFYYSEGAQIEFLPGYDMSVLASPLGEDGVIPAIVSARMLSELGTELGESLRVASLNSDMQVYYLEVLPVGVFEPASVYDNIYVPLDAWCPLDYLFGDLTETLPTRRGEMSLREYLYRFTYTSVVYELSDAAQLPALKDWFWDYGFSEVQGIRQNRTFMVLEDRLYNASVSTLEQHIRYVSAVYPCIYLLMGVIGLVASYLLMVSRRKEFAIMRSLGVPKWRSFLTFFSEQAFLCLLGCAAGLLLRTILSGWPEGSALLLCAGFAVCYGLGACISIAIMNAAPALNILSEED